MPEETIDWSASGLGQNKSSNEIEEEFKGSGSEHIASGSEHIASAATRKVMTLTTAMEARPISKLSPILLA